LLGESFFWQEGRKISRAEDFLGLFFLSPCLGNDFFGKREEKTGEGEEKNGCSDGRIGSFWVSQSRGNRSSTRLNWVGLAWQLAPCSYSLNARFVVAFAGSCAL